MTIWNQESTTLRWRRISLMAQLVKNLSAMREPWVRSLDICHVESKGKEMKEGSCARC